MIINNINDINNNNNNINNNNNNTMDDKLLPESKSFLYITQ